jgi:hypothetical protein
MGGVPMTLKKAIQAIEKHGVLLVFTIDNRPEPLSLWKVFYPRTKMRWEWTDDGDEKVAALWQLRGELSGSGKVVYSKWYRGRATFFSRAFFENWLGAMRPEAGERRLPEVSRQILESLRLDSPQSPKRLSSDLGLTGKDLESTYQRGLKYLWDRFWVVGFGEIEDSSFPSLAVGATEVIFDEVWRKAHQRSQTECLDRAEAFLSQESAFWKYFLKLWAMENRNFFKKDEKN